MFTLAMIKLNQRVKIHMICHNINNMWLLVLLLLTFAGCENCITEEWQDGDLPSTGSSSLILKVKTPLVDDVTRAIGAAGSDDAGDKMNKLLVVLVNGSNEIVDSKVVSNTVTGFVDNTQKEAVIQFDNLAVATYSVYLIANYESVTTVNWSNYVAGNTIDASFKDALVGSLTGTNTPSFETNGMPMTATLTTTLQHGTNTVSAELERVVARFGVNVHNHVVGDYKVVISNVNLSSFNVSDTYLFNHDNELPGSVNYRKFFDSATESTYVPTGKSVTFDTYIYETNDKTNYELSFEVAVFDYAGFDEDNPPKVISTSKPSDEAYSDVIESNEYFLYNVGQERYFYIDDNESLKLAASIPESGDILPYKWTFSGTNNGKIYNVGTKVYLRYDGGSLKITQNSNSATNFTFGKNESKLFMRYGNSGTRYFISGQNGSTVGFTNRNNDNPNNNNQRWELRTEIKSSEWSTNPLEGATASISQSLTYDDEGYVKPLKQIKRNQNIQVGVNLFYNPQEGYFSFEVMKWNEKNEDNVTFN